MAKLKKPEPKTIAIPINIIESLIVAVLGGNKSHIMDVTQDIKRIAEADHPEKFLRKQGRG